MNILGKDFTVFFNKICGIVHGSVYVHSGEVAQNVGDKILVMWYLPDRQIGTENSIDTNRDQIVAKIADLATMCLLQIVKDIQAAQSDFDGLAGFLEKIKSNGAMPNFQS